MRTYLRIRSKADRMVPIFIRQGRNREYRSDLTVNLKGWNNMKQRAYPRTPYLKNLNTELDRIVFQNSTRIDIAKKPLGTYKVLTRMIEDTYLDKWSEGTRRGYNTFLKLLERYGKVPNLVTIDKVVVDDFLSWMRKEGYSKNYQGRQLVRLKTVAREALRIGEEVHQYQALHSSIESV